MATKAFSARKLYLDLLHYLRMLNKANFQYVQFLRAQSNFF